MNLWVIWLLTGLGLLILEMLVPGAFLMWIGLAACATGLLTLSVPMDFAYQVVAFAVFAAMSLTAGLRLRRQPTARLNTQTAGLTGRTAIALSFSGREGRVRLGDSDWSARLPHDAPVPEPGDRLHVEGVDGIVLVVRREG
jgi:membrane protein implicated in regulation of membrane protease activity